MKKLRTVLLLCILLIALASCRTGGLHDTLPPSAEPSDPLPTVEDTSPEETPESQPADDLAGYSFTADITVSDNRTLTLKLYGKQYSAEYGGYGISSIEVFDGDAMLQTISIRDALLADWEDDMGDYTQSWFRDGGLTTADMNFDGAEDIGLFGWITTGANIPYYYWLWDNDSNSFYYAFTLCNAEVDEAEQQIISETRTSAMSYSICYYKYDENGVLQLVKQEEGYMTEG